MASGINSTFRQVGIAASIAALGSIFASRHAMTSPQAFVDTINLLLLIAAGIALVAGALSLALIRARDFVHHGGPAPRGE
jgi:hypothetical protein